MFFYFEFSRKDALSDLTSFAVQVTGQLKRSDVTLRDLPMSYVDVSLE